MVTAAAAGFLGAKDGGEAISEGFGFFWGWGAVLVMLLLLLLQQSHWPQGAQTVVAWGVLGVDLFVILGRFGALA